MISKHNLRCTEKLIPGALIATWMRTAAPTSMRYAKASRSLSTFIASRVFTQAIATVMDTVWSSSYTRLIATLDSAQLINALGKSDRVRRLHYLTMK